MSHLPTIQFAAPQFPASGVLVVLAGKDGALPAGLPDGVRGAAERAGSLGKFKGKGLSTVETIAPAESGLDRIVVVGTAGEEPFGEEDWLKLGGTIQAVFTSSWTGPARIEVCDAPHHLLLTTEPGTDDEGGAAVDRTDRTAGCRAAQRQAWRGASRA